MLSSMLAEDEDIAIAQSSTLDGNCQSSCLACVGANIIGAIPYFMHERLKLEVLDSADSPESMQTRRFRIEHGPSAPFAHASTRLACLQASGALRSSYSVVSASTGI